MTEQRQGAVKVSDLVDALQLRSDEIQYFVDRETGQVVFFTEEAAGYAKRDPESDLPDWMRVEVALAVQVEEQPERYVDLPSSWDVNEYGMMRDFALSRGERECDALSSAIQGRGAFRRFKDTAARLNLLDAWYRYVDQAYRQFAIDWLDAEGIAYLSEDQSD